MEIVRVKDTSKVKALFDGWDETLIWSCLDGTMGYIFAKDVEQPDAAMAWLGDFVFFAGKPTKELVACHPKENTHEFEIMVPQTKEWANLIEEVYSSKIRKVTRYSIKKEGDIFNREHLKSIVDGLEEGYRLKRLGEAEYTYSKQNDWTCDWCSQFTTYDDYQQHGLGYVIYKGDEIVAGASSYSVYQGGIEIEIDTKEEYRRKGLAYCCAAKLILESLERGLYPSWDAANLWSVGLAQKLGYHYDREYTAYFIYNY